MGLTLIHRRWIGGLLGLFVGCWIGRLTLDWPMFQFLGNPMSLEFLAGVVLALWWQGDRRPRRGGVAVLLAALLMAMWWFWGPPGVLDGAGVLDGSTSLARVVWIGVPAALVVYAVLQFEGSWGRLPYLGDASYALYLIHPLVLLVLHMLPLPWWAELGGGVSLSIYASVLIYEGLEKPIKAAKPRPFGPGQQAPSRP